VGEKFKNGLLPKYLPSTKVQILKVTCQMSLSPQYALSLLVNEVLLYLSLLKVPKLQIVKATKGLLSLSDTSFCYMNM
jgi:hypothetical protein